MKLVVRQCRHWLLALGALTGSVPAHHAAATGCFPSPAGVVGWWPGDGNANDIANTNNGALQGGATATATGVAGLAFNFDGTNGFVQIPDAPALKPTNLTVEAWVNFSGLDSARSGTAPAGSQYIVFKQNSHTYSFEGYSLVKNRGANGDAFNFTVSSASGQSIPLVSAALISTSIWYHVAAVRGSNFMQLYVNGRLEGQTNVSFAQDYGTLPLYFGTSGQTYWDGKLKGRLDEVSLYNRALSSNEVAAIYAAGAAGKCKGPSLVTQPQSQAAVVGSNVSLTVTATGAGLLSYQWQFNGTNISAANNTSLALTNVQAADAGSYTVVVTNSFDSVTSTPAVLTVVGLVVTSQPVSQTNLAGTTAVFNVVALGPAPTYQWLKNGTPISGATDATLSLTNVSSSDVGSYSVTVSNAYGNILSSNAMLAVFYMPTANNDSYGVAAGTTLTVLAPGVLGNDTVAGGSNLAVTLATGPIHGTLSLSPDGGFTYTPFTNYVGTDSFGYQAVNGPINSGVATVTLSMTADGVWFSDDFSRLADPGPLSPWVAQSGNWAVTGGALRAGPNTLQSYANLYITNSWTNYSVEGRIEFSTTSAWGGGIGGRLNPATGAHYAVWIYPDSSPGGADVVKLIKFQTWTNFSYKGTNSAVMAAASLAAVGTSWHNLKLAFYGNQIAVYYDGNQALSVTDVEAQPYLSGGASVDTWTYSQAYTMSVSRVVVRPLVVDDSYSGFADTALTVAGPGVLGNDTGVYASNLVAVLASGPTNGTLNLSTNGGFTYTPATNYYGTDSFTYQANQGSNDLGTGTVTITVRALGAPVITQAPLSRTNTAGTTAAFSAGAVGILPLSYQWQFNGANIAGATSTNLTLNDVQPANTGSYTVVVTNSAGTAISAAAVLTVLPTPGTLLINGAQTYQVIDGFGVNANHRAWTNNELAPVLDALVQQAGMTLFRVVYDNSDWEANNQNSGPTLTNWPYFSTAYSTPDFQALWGIMAYLNQKGITNGVIPNFQGFGPSWMGGSSLTPGYENAWAEMIASALIYARYTNHLQFTLVAPNNEPDITGSGIGVTMGQYNVTLQDLAQQLSANGMGDVQFVGPDLANTSTAWLAAMMTNPVVMSKLADFGIHGYQGMSAGSAGVASFLQQSAYPAIHFWMTEYNVWCQICQTGGRGTNNWGYFRGTAEYLLSQLANGASGGMVWEGYDSIYHNNTDNGFRWSFWGLFAVNDTNAVPRTYTARKNFYTLSQVTQFVRPGAQRLDVSDSGSLEYLLAFCNTNNGQFTLTGVNTNSSAATISCALMSLPTIPSLSLYYTSSTSNLCYGGTVALTNGAFSVVVPADCVFTLTVVCPWITVNPAALPGGTAGLNYSQTLGASGGAAPYSYSVTAGTLPTGLSLSSAGILSGTPSEIGTNTFTVTATDTNGCPGSQALTLAVIGVPPIITLQPQSLTNILGTDASFSAAATGAPPPAYQWQFNGTAIPGATGTNLLRTAVSFADAGGYGVVLANAAGAVTSAVAVLTVVCPAITVGPATLASTVVGTAYSQSLTATGGLGPYAFAVTAGTLPAGLSLSSAGILSGTPSEIGTKSFTVTATDTNGCPGSQAFGLAVIGVPPVITLQPQSRTNILGTDASFSVAADGAPPPAYQWQFNGTNLFDGGQFSGATNSTLSISNVQPGQTGGYRVMVTNSAGSATSAVAVLTVASPPLLLNPQTAANGAFTFTLSGGAGLSYLIEVSTNLQDWTPLAAVTNVASQADVTDTTSSNSVSRFYRARLSY